MSEHVTAVTNKLKQYMEEHPSVKQARIAEAVGKSAGAISSFLKGEYKGDNESLATSIDKVISTWIENEKKGFFLETQKTITYRKIQGTLERSRRFPGITVIVGDNGVGKTHTIKDYITKTNDILIESHQGFTCKALCQQICRHLRLAETWFLDSMIDQILTKAPEILLIIDEAENLPIKTLDLARRIHDRSKLNLVLLGSHDLYRALNSRRTTHKYIVGRPDIFEELGNLELQEIYQIFDDISLTVADKARELIVQLSQNNFRILDNLLRVCYDFCKAHNTDTITPTIVNSAKRKILILS